MKNSQKLTKKNSFKRQVQQIVRLHHINCQDSKCHICLRDHLDLAELLDNLCNTDNRIDHLGKLHLWMSKNGYVTETEWGWATPETFEKDNIEAYVNAYKKGEV